MKVKSQEGGRDPVFVTRGSLGQTHKQNEKFLKHSKSQDCCKTWPCRSVWALSTLLSPWLSFPWVLSCTAVQLCLKPSIVSSPSYLLSIIWTQPWGSFHLRSILACWVDVWLGPMVVSQVTFPPPANQLNVSDFRTTAFCQCRTWERFQRFKWIRFLWALEGNPLVRKLVLYISRWLQNVKMHFQKLCQKFLWSCLVLLSEIFELEVNENVQLAVNDRQMPKVEYMEIKIDDYSKYHLSSHLFFSFTAVAVKWYSHPD